jgi:hypothetical protein
LFCIVLKNYFLLNVACFGWVVLFGLCAGRRSAVRQGIALVRSSRVVAGVVSTNIPDKDMDGMVAAGSLSTPKARIALQLALHAVAQAGDNPAVSVWQDVFARSCKRLPGLE